MSKPSPVAKPPKTRRVANTTKQDQPVRLYKKVVRQLIDDLQAGKYVVGDRLPAERELALEHGVSRPAIREAILALEVGGLIEVRVGSGAYVVQLPGDDPGEPGFAISAFEAMEARLVVECEAAALAAAQITDAELAQLDKLVRKIDAGTRNGKGAEEAEVAFHHIIIQATRNAAIELLHQQLWQLRSASPDCALMLKKARMANVRPVSRSIAQSSLPCASMTLPPRVRQCARISPPSSNISCSRSKRKPWRPRGCRFSRRASATRSWSTSRIVQLGVIILAKPVLPDGEALSYV